jgi:23S rRNA pseudouridine955/2504/2580 synthase
LAGDDRYGQDVQNRHFKALGLRRLFLHAGEAGFRHPRTGEAMKVAAPLDPDLEAFLKVLPK